jgi:hypothetical protein
VLCAKVNKNVLKGKLLNRRKEVNGREEDRNEKKEYKIKERKKLSAETRGQQSRERLRRQRKQKKICIYCCILPSVLG